MPRTALLEPSKGRPRLRYAHSYRAATERRSEVEYSRSQCFNHSPQSCGHVFTARIVEVQPILRRAPLIKTADELAVHDLALRPFLPHIRESYSCKRDLHHEFVIIEGDWAGRRERDLLTLPPELPWILCATRVGVLYADVVRELARRLRDLVVAELMSD